MGDILRRLARIEEHFSKAACVCSHEGREIVCVAVESDWNSDQIQMAEAAAQFTCPTHGRKTANLVRISQVDANL
jgi:hypothetical protein